MAGVAAGAYPVSFVDPSIPFSCGYPMSRTSLPVGAFLPVTAHGGWTPRHLVHRYRASMGWWREWLGGEADGS
jgi:hypothetical protein